MAPAEENFENIQYDEKPVDPIQELPATPEEEDLDESPEDEEGDLTTEEIAAITSSQQRKDTPDADDPGVS